MWYFGRFTGGIGSGEDRVQRKICALLLLLCCGTLLLFARYSVISFNEAFWYFIGVVYLLPVVILVDVVEFMFAGARESTDEQG
ncbi:hypothetical protein [Lactiplantibacillus pentosus]|uniref:hypothetical protein n=1 Tax=Lactiplantibacillus pentosus TaxID=1589 RepID=UPI0012FCE69B|nr:hypothetical protein [Lactiplantibacillus pentosus]